MVRLVPSQQKRQRALRFLIALGSAVVGGSASKAFRTRSDDGSRPACELTYFTISTVIVVNTN